MARDETGPAFPMVVTLPSEVTVHYGLTRREYFAGQALAGYFAHPTTPHMNATDAGAYCVAMADALIAALNKE